MKKIQVLGLILVLAFAVTAIAPSPAAASAIGDTSAAAAPSVNSELTITNNAISPVTVYLKGPKSYSVIAPVGKSAKEILKGTYSYTYKACGIDKTGTLKAVGGKSKLNIAKCQTAKLYVINYSDSPFTLTLSGPANYRFTVSPHTYQSATILRGTYHWSTVCKGDSNSGTAALTRGRYASICR